MMAFTSCKRVSRILPDGPIDIQQSHAITLSLYVCSSVGARLEEVFGYDLEELVIMYQNKVRRTDSARHANV